MRKCVNKAVWSGTSEATSPSPNLGGSKRKQVILVTVTLPETTTHPCQVDSEKLGCIYWALQKKFPLHGKPNRNPQSPHTFYRLGHSICPQRSGDLLYKSMQNLQLETAKKIDINSIFTEGIIFWIYMEALLNYLIFKNKLTHISAVSRVTPSSSTQLKN